MLTVSHRIFFNFIIQKNEFRNKKILRAENLFINHVIKYCCEYSVSSCPLTKSLLEKLRAQIVKIFKNSLLFLFPFWLIRDVRESDYLRKTSLSGPRPVSRNYYERTPG